MTWFQRNRARLLVAGLLLFAFLLFVANMKDTRSRNWLDRALLWITSPVQHAFVWLIDGGAGLWRDYVYLVGTRDENQALRSRVEELERELARLRKQAGENRRLRSLVRMRESLETAQVLGARVVGVSTSPIARTIRVDVGSNNGVKIGSAVISGAGLVGRVTATVGGYAEVQLIVDGRSAVDVVIERSRARAIVRGRGEDEVCSVDHLVRTADVEVDDRAVTSGMGGTYPPGLVVGMVTNVTSPGAGVFREADLKPIVSFMSLEEVLVIVEAESGPAAETTTLQTRTVPTTAAQPAEAEASGEPVP